MTDVVVREAGGRYSQWIETGGHVLAADESLASGGTDSGPDPYALLLAALGACTSITLRMYADRKGWPLTGITVRLTQQKVYAPDCAECETRDDSRIDRIEREIELSGPLSEEQRKRMLEIADRCPVHRTLMNPKQIVTRLAGEAS
jgi:uncharacterized OsmC-like protein